MTVTEQKYSDLVCAWLKELGYTHCFFLAGGQAMHLVESASRYFKTIPVVNEVAAGIAAEYFSESGLAGKAFALVTAGPGLTNIVTAFGGAFLESRELLVLGGQVKTADLALGRVRQRGIQEIDGVSIVRPISKLAARLDVPWSKRQLQNAVRHGFTGRKGPVFLEIPLDIQGAKFTADIADAPDVPQPESPALLADVNGKAKELAALVRAAKRPLLLLGGGVSRKTASAVEARLKDWGVPVATTWNGTDRIGADHPLYMGRPNTWGQRYANLILQQADLVLALGTRLGMQQTGFNWQKFAPLAQIVHVDVDPSELEKGHPVTHHPLAIDANPLLKALIAHEVGAHEDWVSFCGEVKAALPLVESGNQTGSEFVSPFALCTGLSARLTKDDLIVPCSSGSAFTVTMQSLLQKSGQVIITNKGSASMGYGLSGAIGLAVAGGGRRTILLEGDGGFAQNIQEIGTVAVNKLNIKIFIFDDHGYASIRMTQRNYFGGKYVGCDIETGLGIPNWDKLFTAYDIPNFRLGTDWTTHPRFTELLEAEGPAAFFVPIDPLQTYFPKITSRVLPNGSMESNPLHRMTPDLDEAQYARLARHLAEQNL